MNENNRLPKAAEPEKAGAAASATVADVVQQEPAMGGSYTRDAATGALTKNEPVVPAQPLEI